MALHHDASHVPVIIVGGGPAGLTTALLLTQHGIGCLVVERRRGVSPLPRATGVNVRTMEIFRGLGLADEVAARSRDSRGLAHSLEMEWLGGPVLATNPYPSAIDPGEPGSPSPEGFRFCSQDVLEPSLVGALECACRASIGWATALLDFEQDDGCVRVRLKDEARGTVRRVTCDYLVAADGAGSLVRRSLGIAMRGHDHLTHDLNIVFEAELARVVRGRNALLHVVHHERLGNGIFRNLDGIGRRWSLFTTWFDKPTNDRCAEVIRDYVREDGLPVRVTAVGEWERATLLADRFRHGRVFLVGDSAHRMTPHAGLGMNTAIQSAHNLAWKLSAVLGGWAGEHLLDTYEIERRGAGAQTVDLSYRLFQSPTNRSGDVLGHVLGMAYAAGALVPDGTLAPAPSNPVSEYVPAARPGHRAPHLWFGHAGKRLSTLDLFGRGFALVSPSRLWMRAAHRIAAKARAPLSAHLIEEPAWSELYGIRDGGAVLVRPDGYVAWRTPRALPEPEAVIADVLAELLRTNH